MQLLVEIQFCRHCYQHAWCSQHDEEKYMHYFQQIRESVLKKVKLGDDLIIRPKDVPKHYVKVNRNNKDDKYYDAQKEEEVHFPRLGAFEIYVDGIQIFSKLKSNMWPNVEKQAETIVEMIEGKKEGNNLNQYYYGNSIEEKEKDKFNKVIKRRQITSKVPQRERALPQLSMQERTKYNASQDNTGQYVYEMVGTDPKSLNLDERRQPNSVKNYHQIYSSALYEMREQAKRERIKSKEKSRDKYNGMYARKSQNMNKRKDRYQEQEEEGDEFLQISPVRNQKKSSSRKRKPLKRELQKNSSPVRKPKPIDKLIEDELNISEVVTPHELNEQEKKMLYKKYNIQIQNGPKGVNDKKLQAQKRKYETLLDALKHEQQNYVQKLEVLNKKLGIPPIKYARTIEPRRVSKQSDNSEVRADKQKSEMSLPPIRNQFSISDKNNENSNKNFKSPSISKQSQKGEINSQSPVRDRQNIVSKKSSIKEVVPQEIPSKQQVKIIQEKVKYKSLKTQEVEGPPAKVNNYLQQKLSPAQQKEQKVQQEVKVEEQKPFKRSRVERRKLSMKKIVDMSIEIPPERPVTQGGVKRQENQFNSQVVNENIYAQMQQKLKTKSERVEGRQIQGLVVNEENSKVKREENAVSDNNRQKQEVMSRSGSRLSKNSGKIKSYSKLGDVQGDISRVKSKPDEIQEPKQENVPIQKQQNMLKLSQKVKSQPRQAEPQVVEKLEQNIQQQIKVEQKVENIKNESINEGKIEQKVDIQEKVVEQAAITQVVKAQQIIPVEETIEVDPAIQNMEAIAVEQQKMEEIVNQMIVEEPLQVQNEQIPMQQIKQDKIECPVETMHVESKAVEEEVFVEPITKNQEIGTLSLQVKGVEGNIITQDKQLVEEVPQQVRNEPVSQPQEKVSQIVVIQNHVENIQHNQIIQKQEQIVEQKVKEEPQEMLVQEQKVKTEPQEIHQPLVVGNQIPSGVEENVNTHVNQIQQEQIVKVQAEVVNSLPQNELKVETKVKTQPIEETVPVQSVNEAQIVKQAVKVEQKQQQQQNMFDPQLIPMQSKIMVKMPKEQVLPQNEIIQNTQLQKGQPQVVVVENSVVVVNAESQAVKVTPNEQQSSKINSSEIRKSSSPSRRPPGRVGRISQSRTPLEKEKPEEDSSLIEVSETPSKSLQGKSIGKVIDRSPKNLKKVEKIVLHVGQDSPENPFFAIYEINKNKVTKKYGDGLWHTLKTHEILPYKGVYSVTFDILESSMNCIEVGLMPQKFRPVENKICDRSIGFHFANGRIHDTFGDKEKKSTKWRLGRQATEEGTTGVIQMIVDVDQQVIKWKLDGQQFAFSTLTDYLKGQNCVAFVSMVHVKDTVIISPKRERQRSPSPSKIIEKQGQSTVIAHQAGSSMRESKMQRNDNRVKSNAANQIDIPISKSQIGHSLNKINASNIQIQNQDKNEEQVFKKFNLKIDNKINSNPFFDIYEVEENKITKNGGDNMWHILKTQDVLPSTGKYSFAISVTQSELNCIEVGIMPRDYIPVEKKICEKSLGFHFANGKVHDTKGNKEKKTTSWRAVCEPAPVGKVGKIQINVDADNQKVYWKYQNQVIGKSVLTNYLKQLPCVAYISCFSNKDIVTLDNTVQLPLRKRKQSEFSFAGINQKNLIKQQKESINQKEQISTDEKKIFLKIGEENQNNLFRKYYRGQNQQITKTGGNNFWHILKTEGVLPSTGKYSFAVTVTHSQLNCIEVGIMPRDYVPIENKICQKSLGFHYANGKVHDTKGNKEKKTTGWRAVCEPAPVGKLGKIQLSVDADAQVVYWKFDGEVIAKSVLTNYLKEQPCVAFVSLVHENDVVCFEKLESKISERLIEAKVESAVVRDSILERQETRAQPVNEVDIPIGHSQIGHSLDNSQSLSKVKVQENEKIVPEDYQKVNLSVSSDVANNLFRQLYQVDERKITKTGGNNFWHILKTEGVLPSTGKYSFAVTVTHSQLNCIEVGIMPRDYVPIENKICQKSLGFHYANGKVHDTKGNKEKKTTGWRAVCEPAPVGKLGKIQLSVDADAQVVYWKFDGEVIAKSVLTNYLKEQPCVAFVSLVHENDVVCFEKLESKISERLIEAKVESAVVRDSILERQETRAQPVNEVDIPIGHSQIGHSLDNSQSLSKVKVQENEKIVPEDYQKVNLSVSSDVANNLFRQLYQVDERKITKTGGNNFWHILKTEGVLPSTGKYSFAVTVTHSQLNCIEVGIMPRDYVPIENKICQKSLGFHYANGKVHDTKGNKEKKTTGWRAVCEPAPVGKLGKIQLSVDADAQVVYWKFDGEVIAKSVLTNYLKEQPCVAFVSLVHENDVVCFEKLESKISERLIEAKVESAVVRDSILERQETRAQPVNEVDIPIGHSQIGHSLDNSQSLSKVKVQENEKIVPEDYQKVNLSVSSDVANNLFRQLYQVDERKITKTGGNNFWHILKTEGVLPSTGKYSFAVTVTHSQLNCIEVGIMPRDYVPIENKICQKSLGFHYANGKVHDTKGNKEKKTTGWRAVCEPAPVGKLGKIQLSVDADAQVVYWKFDGEVIAKSVLTNYLKEQPCVAFVSLVHENDVVFFENNPSFLINPTSPVQQPKFPQQNTVTQPQSQYSPIESMPIASQQQHIQYPQFNFSISSNQTFNPFSYMYKVEEQKVKKIMGNGQWHIIKSKEELPSSGKYSLAFKIVKSQMNCIEVGIMPGDYEPIQNKICVKSLGFNYANGKLHDSNGQRQKKSTKWRQVCAPVPPGVLGTIELDVNNDQSMIYWKFQGQVFAESVITDYLKESKLHAYVSMVHIDDIVNLNQSLNGPSERKQEVKTEMQTQQNVPQYLNVKKVEESGQ